MNYSFVLYDLKNPARECTAYYVFVFNRRDHLCMYAACGSKDTNQESFPSKMLRSTVLKAFFRSRKRSPFSEPSSIFKYQSFVASSVAVRVECIVLKQC